MMEQSPGLQSHALVMRLSLLPGYRDLPLFDGCGVDNLGTLYPLLKCWALLIILSDFMHARGTPSSHESAARAECEGTQMSRMSITFGLSRDEPCAVLFLHRCT